MTFVRLSDLVRKMSDYKNSSTQFWQNLISANIKWRKLLDFIEENLKACSFLGEIDGRNISK
jgi:hypothetical protein